MSSMERLRPVIRALVMSGAPLMPATLWAMPYRNMDTDITAEAIQAEMDAAMRERDEIDLIRNRPEAET